EIDEHCLDRLKRLDEDVAVEVINKFCEANFLRVKNKVGHVIHGNASSHFFVFLTSCFLAWRLSLQSGFLSGIIRRFEDDPRGSRAGMANLPRDLKERFDPAIEKGLMTDTDLEARVCDQLAPR
ncbi:MAG: hypothetical protein AAGJ52_12100, partial [Pseudomonadota bacterium]